MSTLGSGNGSLAGQIDGAAQLALLRAREAAGSRIRSYVKRDSSLKAEFSEVANRDLAAALGRDRVRGLGCPPDTELVSGARALVEDALRMWGISGREADKVAAMLERHAVKTLYDEVPAPLPSTFAKLAATIHGE